MALAAVAVAAADASVVAIACYTRTGRTARLLSALRPGVPIHAFSDEPHTVNRLALVHGIAPAGCPAPAASGSRLEWLARIVERASVVPPGSVVALVASSADPGTGPNLLELHRLP
jgi:pyruvate kinase